MYFKAKHIYEQNKTKCLIDAITSFYGLVITYSISYPKSRDRDVWVPYRVVIVFET